ncbi:hypothetical protein DPW03_04640 [Aggregatibacter aphrophilus]|nr:hypothetical protein DPW00_02950 [Aggregatibacter aphrophilus]RDE95884.1 hypothetical protein DPW03_04640 [Aggregatibacter aphrophilus]RDE97678.1 hypothetical protein DPW02_03410 [Aggregatibacter aphrophilus]
MVECSSFIKSLTITVGLTDKKYHICFQSAKISIKCGHFFMRNLPQVTKSTKNKFEKINNTILELAKTFKFK